MIQALLAAERGMASKIAAASGLSRPYVWQCAVGKRKFPLKALPTIERATGGRVTVDQLRPDVTWHRVADPDWPHPEGRPTIDVAAPQREAA